MFQVWQRDVVLIRTATAHDLADVQRIAAEAFAPYVELIGRNPAPMDADYPELITRGCTWVAVTDESMAGFCVVIPEDGYLLLDVLAVAAGSQGRGIGRRLITFVEGLARTTGMPELRLYTNQKMTENLKLYPHLGFRETRRSSENGFHRVHYAKSISAS